MMPRPLASPLTQALARCPWGPHHSNWGLPAWQQGQGGTAPEAPGERSRPRGLCLTTSAASELRPWRRASDAPGSEGVFLVVVGEGAPSPCCLPAAPTLPCGSSPWVVSTARAGLPRGLGWGGSWAGHNWKPPEAPCPGWSSTGCRNLSSGHTGLCCQPGATSATLASPEPPSCPLSPNPDQASFLRDSHGQGGLLSFLFY